MSLITGAFFVFVETAAPFSAPSPTGPERLLGPEFVYPEGGRAGSFQTFLGTKAGLGGGAIRASAHMPHPADGQTFWDLSSLVAVQATAGRQLGLVGIFPPDWPMGGGVFIYPVLHQWLEIGLGSVVSAGVGLCALQSWLMKADSLLAAPHKPSGCEGTKALGGKLFASLTKPESFCGLAWAQGHEAHPRLCRKGS